MLVVAGSLRAASGIAAEESVLVRVIFENTLPKLIGDDIPALMSIIRDLFTTSEVVVDPQQV